MNFGVHDALQAMGPQAAHIVELWRIFVFICTGVFALVLAALLVALWRAPRAGSDLPPDLGTVNRAEPGPRRSVAAAVAASVLLLLVLIAASIFTDRALARLPLKDALNIEVTAHQWWWTVRYIDGGPDQTFETANEIHVPVGRPVLVQLKSDDVIHSLWIPSLAGKKDLIPGRTAMMAFRADQAGVYRGQCAEFCGYQHAFMALTVHARSAGEFDAWRRQQLRTAPEATTDLTRRGKQVVESTTCAMCHTVLGTQAQGKRAPDLTHVATRPTLAAGTLENTPGNLASWIADPQQHKPGTNMPSNLLSPEDLAAVVAYLETLK
jgi:cytochrome c oxidase subunit 2